MANWKHKLSGEEENSKQKDFSGIGLFGQAADLKIQERDLMRNNA